MSDTYVLRLFVADRDPALPAGAAYRPDGHVHGTVVRVVTGRQRPFRDDAGLIAALRELAGEVPAAPGCEPGANVEDGHGTV